MPHELLATGSERDRAHAERVLLGSRGAAPRPALRALRAAARASLAVLIPGLAAAQAGEPASIDELLEQPARQAGLAKPSSGWDARSIADLAEAWLGFADPNKQRLRAENVRRCREALERAPAERVVVEYYTWQSGLAAVDAGQVDDACAEFRHGIETGAKDDAFVVAMRVDLADVLQRDGCWRDARAELAKAATDLAPRDESDVARFQRTEACGRWYGVHGEIDLKVGLPERAASRFADERERAVDAWKIQQSAFPGQHSMLKWAALAHELELALATGDFARVESRWSSTESDPMFADRTPDLAPQFAVLRGAAVYERERRGELDASGARAMLESVIADPAARSIDRDEARIQLAKLALEHEDWSSARGALDVARAAHSRSRAPRCGGDPVAVELDAIDARMRIESATDPAERARALADFERSFETFLAAWSEAPDRDGGIAFLRYGERYLVLDQLIRSCLAVDGPERGARRALTWVADAQLLGSLASQWKLARKPLDAWLAPLLRDGGAVLAVQPGRVRSSLFVADATGVSVRDVDGDWKIRRRVGELQNAAARAVHASGERSAPPLGEARALAESVLAHDVIARASAWTHAWVIGDETFGHLALELAPLEDGRRLGDVLPLDYAPSLPVAAELAERAASRGIREASSVMAGLVGAASIGAASAARWNPTPIEIDASTRRRWSEIWGGRWREWIGDEATPAALRGAAANGVDALQVVAHGVQDVERDASIGFLLAGEPGELWPEDLGAAAPRLVLVAACQTDAHPVRQGDDGRASWAGRFAAAGSDCVVLTPFDLELGRALELFDRVQRSIRDGEPPSHALVLARRELASDGGARAQDYLVYAWGAGSQPIVARASRANDAREPAASDRTRWAWIAVAAGSLASLALAWSVRRSRARAR